MDRFRNCAIAWLLSFAAHGFAIYWSCHTTSELRISDAPPTVIAVWLNPPTLLPGPTVNQAQLAKVAPDTDRKGRNAADQPPAPQVPASADDLPYYYPVSYLDQPPRILGDYRVELTEFLQNLPAESPGFRLLLNEDGGVDDIVLDTTADAQQLLARLKEAFSSWKFLPGILSGKPVKSEFRLENDQVIPLPPNQ